MLMTLSVGGVAIWAMHFIGMSAVTLYTPDGTRQLPVRFRVDLTITSLIVVLVLTFLGLYIGSADKAFIHDRRDVVDSFIADVKSQSIEKIKKIKHKNLVLGEALFKNLPPLIFGGFLIASGVCVMHFVGMQAMEFEGHMEWDQGIVATAVLIALVAATAALWIIFRLLSMFPNVELLRLGAAVVMAVAVNGMHYTGMAAANFMYDAGVTPPNYQLVDSATAEQGAIIGAVIFICFVFVIAVSDLRVWYHNQSRVFGELDARIERALMEDNKVLRDEFYHAYLALRDADGVDKAIAEFRRISNRLSENKSSQQRGNSGAPGKGSRSVERSGANGAPSAITPHVLGKSNSNSIQRMGGGMGVVPVGVPETIHEGKTVERGEHSGLLNSDAIV